MADKKDRIALAALRRVDKISDARVLQFDRVWRDLQARLVAEVTAGEIAGTVDLALATANVQRLLEESGYYEQVGQLLNDDYQKAIDTSFEQYKRMYGGNFLFAETSLERLNALKAIHLAELNRLGDGLALEISLGIIEKELGAITREQLFFEVFENTIAKNRRWATTWTKTGTSGYFTESNMTLAEDNGLNKFRYGGVVDPDTRKFCRNHVGEVRTRAGWNSLNEEQGQIPPVSIYRGGFNCKHTLYAVGATEAE